MLVSAYHPTYAQLNDANWFMGFSQTQSGEYGMIGISFISGNAEVRGNLGWEGYFSHNNTIFSDSFGNYLTQFQGEVILDKSYHIMKNGDSVWYSPEPFSNNILGYADDKIPQGGLFLMWPGSKDSLLLFYSSKGLVNGPGGESTIGCRHLQYALINLSGNNGLGQVIFRRKALIVDSLQHDRLIPVKHANGRDWWLPVFEHLSDRYYRVLIDPSGVHLMDSASVGSPFVESLGQAHFSQDGKRYAVANAVSATYGNFLDLYDFDRCSGLFYNHRSFHYPGGLVTGCAFSPSGRYLYVNFQTTLYQYDMESPNPDSTKILISGLVAPPPGETVQGYYYQMQLAPDGKIYMSSTSTIRSLHVIHQPDEPGIACQFQAYGLPLPARNSFSVTYSPNYRLGPLDGSPCDTLGLDNRPIAWFRFQRDTMDSLSVYFHDLSYYEPTSWSWDFGNGTTSTARHPVHTYASAGKYEVCLTVSNAHATNTFCRTLFLGVSASEDPEIQERISVFPNPFHTQLAVAAGSNLRHGIFYLYDLSGRLVQQMATLTGVREMETGDLAAGIYFWEVREGGERVCGGKVVKM